MQAIVVDRVVSMQQRRRLGLPARMAALEPGGMLGGKALRDLHLLVPAVRDIGERRGQRNPPRQGGVQARRGGRRCRSYPAYGRALNGSWQILRCARYGERCVAEPPDTRDHSFAAEVPAIRPNTVAVSSPLPDR